MRTRRTTTTEIGCFEAFAAAHAEVDEIVSLVQQMSGRTVNVGDLVAPDPARSSASEGRRILQDAKFSCLVSARMTNKSSQRLSGWGH